MKFGIFVLLYSLMKVIRMMMAATVWMTAALAVCRIGGHKTWRLNLAMLSLVPLACLMGYSKIFFTGKLLLLTNWMQRAVTEEMAICYFTAAGILAVRYLYLHKSMRHRLSGMEQLKEGISAYVKLGRGPRIQVYLAKESCSPFAGGILKPYIVVPKNLKKSLTREEFSAVLYHEVLHIRQGHVLLLNIYAWLKIIWWIHPLIYLLEQKLREHMEYSCDEGSILLGPLCSYEYAGVILKTLQMEQQADHIRDSVTTFYDHCYGVLKRRVERLGKLKADTRAIQEYRAGKRRSAILTAAAGITAVIAVLGTSLPRYTKIREIAAYDETLHPLTYDLEKEGFQAKTADEAFYISKQEMQRFAAKYRLQGGYVIFSYDTIMKVPGVGGLGQAARVRVEDASEVFPLARWEWTDRLEVFILKYLI